MVWLLSEPSGPMSFQVSVLGVILGVMALGAMLADIYSRQLAWKVSITLTVFKSSAFGLATVKSKRTCSSSAANAFEGCTSSLLTVSVVVEVVRMALAEEVSLGSLASM